MMNLFSDLTSISNFANDRSKSNNSIANWLFLLNIIMLIVYILVAVFNDGTHIIVTVSSICVSLCGILFGLYMKAEAKSYKFIRDAANELLFNILKKENEERKNKEGESVLYAERR